MSNLSGSPGPVGSPLMVGYPTALNGSSSSFSTAFTLDQATDAREVIFQVPAAFSGSITRLGFLQGIVTGTSPVYKLSIQGVTAAGVPDGTIKGGGSPASVTFTPDALGDGLFQWKNLDNAYTPSPGEFLAYVIARDSGTIDGSNNCSFSPAITNVHDTGMPVSINNNNGSRSRSSSCPVFGWGTASVAYGMPIQAVTTNIAVNSGTTPAEVGFKFLLPSGAAQSYTVGAVICKVSFAASAVLRVTLYDSDGTTVLQQIDYDGDFGASASGTSSLTIAFDDATLAELTPGTTYYIGLAPQNTNSATFHSMDFAAAADLDATPGGRGWHYVSRDTAGSGSFTDAENRRLVAGVVVYSLTAGDQAEAAPAKKLFIRRPTVSYSPVVTVTPTVNTAQYSAGDVVGSLMTFAGVFGQSRTGILNRVAVRDKSNQKPVMRIAFFRSRPAATFTNNAAFALSAADFARLLFFVDVTADDWQTVDSKGEASVDVGRAVCNADSSESDRGNLYAVAYTTGTPTLTAADDISVDVGVLAD